jgi:UDP-GlcNAc:undecaprenyl-phosphate GlcNAc-1-phosphate transferase
MAGSLFFVESPGQIMVHLAFIGAVLGFLRYNFNPASVFLGDTGSMFLGFFLSTVPLVTRAGGSFLVGVGVPLLAMGVPIFDTALAIVRRTVRAVMRYEDGSAAEVEGTRVMQADADHIHHRLLRKFVSQRKTAAMMYGFAIFLVLVGIGGVALRDRAAGLFIVAFIVGTFVVVRDMSRVELLDAGKLADAVAHSHSDVSRRRRAAFSVPLLVAADIIILSLTWYATLVVLKIKPSPQSFHTFLPLRVAPVFFALVAFKAYSTIWSRAMLSNYIRLILAVMSGVLASTAIMVLLGYNQGRTLAFPAIHFGISLLLLLAVRSVRPFMRDYFYFVNARKLADDPTVSRVLVFGAGLRYRAFRREMVRKFQQERRIIVGLVDDDILLRGKMIGGIRVDGPHMEAKRIVAETRADSVVIACELTPERLKAVVDTFRLCGVKISHFGFSEQPV